MFKTRDENYLYLNKSDFIKIIPKINIFYFKKINALKLSIYKNIESYFKRNSKNKKLFEKQSYFLNSTNTVSEIFDKVLNSEEPLTNGFFEVLRKKYFDEKNHCFFIKNSLKNFEVEVSQIKNNELLGIPIDFACELKNEKILTVDVDSIPKFKYKKTKENEDQIELFKSPPRLDFNKNIEDTAKEKILKTETNKKKTTVFIFKQNTNN